jgi:hypothetical protein
MAFERIYQVWARLTGRERRLFAIFGVLIAVFALGGGWVATSVYISSIAEEVDASRKALQEARHLVPAFKAASDAKAEIERLVKDNKDTSIRVVANETLKKIDLADDVPGATGTTMSDIVSFEGKTNETPIVTKKKKAKGKQAGSGFVMVEQKLEFRDVPLSNLLEFLDNVAQSKEPLFLTKLEVARKFDRMTHVRAEVTIGTVKFQEGAGEADTKKKGQKGGVD